MATEKTYRDIAIELYGEDGLRHLIEQSVQGSSRAEGVSVPSYAYRPSREPVRIAPELRLASVSSTTTHG